MLLPHSRPVGVTVNAGRGLHCKLGVVVVTVSVALVTVDVVAVDSVVLVSVDVVVSVHPSSPSST